MRKSISSMYFSTTAALLVASTAVLCVIQMYLVIGYFKSDKHEALNDVMNIAEAQVKRDPELWSAIVEHPALARTVQENMALISETSSTTIFITDMNGRIMLCSDGASCPNHGKTLPRRALAKAAEEDEFFETGDLDGLLKNRCYTVGRLVKTEGRPLGYVFALASAESMKVFVSDMFSSFILAAGLMLLASSIFAIFFTNRLTTPLRRISEAARRFGSGDFSVRVPVDADDEVSQLAVTFNTMARNLETIDSSRASFMGNIAHELRTPMTSIKGFIDGMLDGTIPDDMREHYLGLVSREVGRLTRLIQNMLDISKLEAGEYRVNAQVYDVWDSVMSVAFSAEQRIEDHHIQIEGLNPKRINVYADQDLVYQVVYNILDNAIKFTPDGGTIKFGVQKSGGFATISIRNTGEGIAKDALPFVFERFYKEDRSRGLNAKGSGLGLHICKVLVGLSGGKIWAESEEGQWCQFSFTLPCDGPGR